MKFGVGLQVRLKPSPMTDPLVIKSDEHAKVPVEMCLAESSKDGDGSSGVPVFTPIVGDPVDCDVLLGCRIRCWGDASLIGCLNQEPLKLPRVVRIMAGEQSYSLGVDDVGSEPLGRDHRELVRANKA